MSKSVLVIDTPTKCFNCQLCECIDDEYYCIGYTTKESSYIGVEDNNTILPHCPLHLLPQPEVANEYDFESYKNGVSIGWNRCLEKITGEPTWRKTNADNRGEDKTKA